jgi:hypothetical protein
MALPLVCLLDNDELFRREVNDEGCNFVGKRE